MNMEAACSFEMSIDFQTEDVTFHNHRCDKLKILSW
jgi:hypothetical protein